MSNSNYTILDTNLYRASTDYKPCKYNQQGGLMPQTESLYTGRRINVRAIIYREGKILAVKHRRGDQAAPYYAVPGGGLDPHESLTECLIRELREETGVTAKPGKLLFIQQFPSSRASYEEELEFFFAVDNPDDFTDIDISQTTHGAQELAVCEYIDPSQHVLYPEFLQNTDIALYINGDQPVLVVDNFNEQHQQLL
ncbi:NUDIX domain-containing protein [TM7 phylum sp. oral taxon 346]|nr:NUDIX domain-containing protein [TM7 phylum sp. oral taxon 346]